MERQRSTPHTLNRCCSGPATTPHSPLGSWPWRSPSLGGTTKPYREVVSTVLPEDTLDPPGGLLRGGGPWEALQDKRLALMLISSDPGRQGTKSGIKQSVRASGEGANGKNHQKRKHFQLCDLFFFMTVLPIYICPNCPFLKRTI